MQVLYAKRGCVISVSEQVSDCPECGALRNSRECGICGWTEPTAEHKPAPVVAPRDPEPKKADPFESKLDVRNESSCVQCGGNYECIDGIIQCPVCGPPPGAVLPPAKPLAKLNPRLPNIDDKLPADPRCPKCLEAAEGAARVRSEIPIEIGERVILTNWDKGGAIELLCPICDFREELAPGRPNINVLTNTNQNDHGLPPNEPSSAAVSMSPAAPPGTGVQPPLEVKRRKRG